MSPHQRCGMGQKVWEIVWGSRKTYVEDDLSHEETVSGRFALLLPLFSGGCAKAGSEGVSLSVIYGATALLALVLL